MLGEVAPKVPIQTQHASKSKVSAILTSFLLVLMLGILSWLGRWTDHWPSAGGDGEGSGRVVATP
jgi:hypothetical protein